MVKECIQVILLIQIALNPKLFILGLYLLNCNSIRKQEGFFYQFVIGGYCTWMHMIIHLVKKYIGVDLIFLILNWFIYSMLCFDYFMLVSFSFILVYWRFFQVSDILVLLYITLYWNTYTGTRIFMSVLCNQERYCLKNKFYCCSYPSYLP